METQELATIPQNGLVKSGERGVTFGSLAEMKEFARDVVNSNLAPRDFKTPEAVLVAMQHGMELGLSPMQSLHSIAIINGRPSIYGDAALALVKNHRDCMDVIETFERGKSDDEMKATCEVQRRDQTPVIRSFSVAQAKKAGLWGKQGPWSQYPQRMLQMRARSFALRDSFPDALKGFRVGEEERDIEPRPIKAREVSSKLVLPGDPPPQEPEPEPEALKLDERDEEGNFKF